MSVLVVCQLAGGLGVAWAKVGPQGSANMLDLLPFRDGLGDGPRAIPESASSSEASSGEQARPPASEILDPWAALPSRKAVELSEPRIEPGEYPNVTEPARLYAPPLEQPSMAELPLLSQPDDGQQENAPQKFVAPQDPLAWVRPALEIVDPWPEAQPALSGDPIRIVSPWATEAAASP